MVRYASSGLRHPRGVWTRAGYGLARLRDILSGAATWAPSRLSGFNPADSPIEGTVSDFARGVPSIAESADVLCETPGFQIGRRGDEGED